jgi:hypothetical protein
LENEAAVAAPAGEAVISESVSSQPQALGSQTVPKEQPQEAPKTEPKSEAKPEPKAEVAKSAREAISRAQQNLKEKQAATPKAEATAPKPEAKEAPKEQPKAEAVRDETGKFASPNPKPQAAEATEQQGRGQSEGSRFEAPSRFNAQAKTEWEKAPDSIKAETLRAIKELEDGHQKYKASHERYEHLREFDETAKNNGRDLKESLKQVVEFETTMRTNPIAAIDFALRHAGPRKNDGSPLTLNDIVQHVSGQSTDQRLQSAQTEINQLRQQIQKMETEAKIPQIIDEFKASHERFDELTPVMVPLLKAGHSLETAYELADALKPASQAAPAPLTPANNEAQAQTLASTPKPANPAGLKSISGNPSLGSNPTGDRSQVPLKETPSIKDSLRKALSKAS